MAKVPINETGNLQENWIIDEILQASYFLVSIFCARNLPTSEEISAHCLLAFALLILSFFQLEDEQQNRKNPRNFGSNAVGEKTRGPKSESGCRFFFSIKLRALSARLLAAAATAATATSDARCAGRESGGLQRVQTPLVVVVVVAVAVAVVVVVVVVAAAVAAAAAAAAAIVAGCCCARARRRCGCSKSAIFRSALVFNFSSSFGGEN